MLALSTANCRHTDASNIQYDYLKIAKLQTRAHLSCDDHDRQQRHLCGISVHSCIHYHHLQGQILKTAVIWFDVDHIPAGSAYVALSKVRATITNAHNINTDETFHTSPCLTRLSPTSGLNKICSVMFFVLS